MVFEIWALASACSVLNGEIVFVREISVNSKFP